MFEYGVALIDSYCFINAFCIVRENLGRQGKNLSQRIYQYRHMFLEQAAEWARRCMINCFSRKKRFGSINLIRSYVTKYFMSNSDHSQWTIFIEFPFVFSWIRSLFVSPRRSFIFPTRKMGGYGGTWFGRGAHAAAMISFGSASVVLKTVWTLWPTSALRSMTKDETVGRKCMLPAGRNEGIDFDFPRNGRPSPLTNQGEKNRKRKGLAWTLFLICEWE